CSPQTRWCPWGSAPRMARLAAQASCTASKGRCPGRAPASFAGTLYAAQRRARVFDLLVVGSGAAGLSAARRAADQGARESRGAHFRIDAPEPDPVWLGRIVWRSGHMPAFEE